MMIVWRRTTGPVGVFLGAPAVRWGFSPAGHLGTSPASGGLLLLRGAGGGLLKLRRAS